MRKQPVGSIISIGARVSDKNLVQELHFRALHHHYSTEETICDIWERIDRKRSI